MNGLSYFYNALNNRQARIERDEREAQRILEQEQQRRQRAAANKHAGMMNTLNLLGTVGGAVAGASGARAGIVHAQLMCSTCMLAFNFRT